jgi:hypothetical protein
VLYLITLVRGCCDAYCFGKFTSTSCRLKTSSRIRKLHNERNGMIHWKRWDE